MEKFDLKNPELIKFILENISKILKCENCDYYNEIRKECLYKLTRPCNSITFKIKGDKIHKKENLYELEIT